MPYYLHINSINGPSIGEERDALRQIVSHGVEARINHPKMANGEISQGETKNKTPGAVIRVYEHSRPDDSKKKKCV